MQSGMVLAVQNQSNLQYATNSSQHHLLREHPQFESMKPQQLRNGEVNELHVVIWVEQSTPAMPSMVGRLVA